MSKYRKPYTAFEVFAAEFYNGDEDAAIAALEEAMGGVHTPEFPYEAAARITGTTAALWENLDNAVVEFDRRIAEMTPEERQALAEAVVANGGRVEVEGGFLAVYGTDGRFMFVV